MNFWYTLLTKVLLFTGQQKACGSITLLKGPHNVIVDTGNPWDKDLILQGRVFFCLEIWILAKENINLTLYSARRTI